MKTGRIGGSKGAQQIEMGVFSFSYPERLCVGFWFSFQVSGRSVSSLPVRFSLGEFFIFLMRFSGFLTGFHMGVENYKLQFQLQMQIHIRFRVPMRVQGTDFFVSIGSAKTG